MLEIVEVKFRSFKIWKQDDALKQFTWGRSTNLLEAVRSLRVQNKGE